MKNRLFLGIFAIFALIGSAAFGAFSENSRQGSEPIFSISGQGVEVLNPATDPGSEDNGSENRARLNNFAKVLTPFLFQGRRWDGLSQTYNHRWRQYSPKVGRFISPDLLGFEADNNLYRFAKDNPVIFVDPSGLKIIPSGDTQTYQAARNLLISAGYGNYLDLMDKFPYNINLTISKDSHFIGTGWERGNCTPLIQDRTELEKLKKQNEDEIKCGKTLGQWVSAKDVNVVIYLGSKSRMRYFVPETDAAFVAHEMLHEGLHGLDFHEFTFDHPHIYSEQLGVRQKLNSLGLLYDPAFDRYRKDRKITGPKMSDF